MKYLLKYILLCYPCLSFAIEPSQNLKSQLVSNKNDQEFFQALAHFPKESYRECTIPKLGTFLVDSEIDGIKWHLIRGIY